METKCHDGIEPIIFNKDIIIKSLHALPNKISCGPDSIPSILLKNISDAMSLPLSIIFQKSFNLGKLPNLWKITNIIPINKGSGNKFTVDNYRPISLTSNICKVMESIIFDKIYNYFFSRNLLTAAQHGFRQKKSTVSNFLELLDDLTKLVDSGNCVDMIAVDFSKTFDKILHNKSLFKLSQYYVTDKLLNWIREFLIGRSFNFCINSCASQLFNVCSSVPKGSKLV